MTVSRADIERRYARRQTRERQREIITPEGIPLSLVLASAGDRAVALIIDLVLVTLMVVVVVVVAMLASGGRADSWAGALAMLSSFLVRNFYFAFFELKRSGTTPGKRYQGLRVIDRHGGALTAEAVLARNLTRDIEVFLPLTVVFAPEALWPDAPGPARVLAGLWCVVFAILPLLNKDRMRIGDMIAGTLVVETPRAVLLPDLAATAARSDELTFTREQLEVYGIFELQVLEDLLRRQDPEALLALATVCDKVKRKIGWDPARAVEPHRFLTAFYAAQRRRLEHKLLFGERKERKQ